MTRYLWDGEHFVNRKTGEPMAAPDRIALPSIVVRITRSKTSMMTTATTSISTS